MPQCGGRGGTQAAQNRAYLVDAVLDSLPPGDVTLLGTVVERDALAAQQQR